MFQKVLLADDLISVNSGVESLLRTLKIPEITNVQYCDDAYLKILNAHQRQQDYELVITDLSFEPDFRVQKIISGEQLIIKLKRDFPALKIIAYTVEDKPGLVDNLVNKHNLDAYVSKGRNGLQELKQAIDNVYEGEKYISPQIQALLRGTAQKNITNNDIILLQLLSKGMSQSQISQHLRSKGVHPSSLSSIEKQLGRLRDYFGAKNAIQMVAMAKDLGLI